MKADTITSLKRGIALFGGNFVLPYETQTNISNNVSLQYLRFCQQYNEQQYLRLSKTMNERRDQDNLSSLNRSRTQFLSNTDSKEAKKNMMEYLVLAPRKKIFDSNKTNEEREFYDIATIVSIETCPQTGEVKALSKGVDSLVRIKKSSSINNSGSKSLLKSFEKNVSNYDRIIIENEPRNLQTQVVRSSELSYEVIGNRKVFFCDYEALHLLIPEYSIQEKKHFVYYIHDLAHRIQLCSLKPRAYLEQLAYKNDSSVFPRPQLLELLKHLDSKYFFSINSLGWIEQKYEILRTKNDKKLLQLLFEVSSQLSL